MYTSVHWSHAAASGEAQWAVRIGCCVALGQLELGAAVALRKAVWWDLCLASLLMHLFCHLFANVVLGLVSSLLSQEIG